MQTTLNMAELSRDNQLLFLSRDHNRRCRLKHRGDVYFVTMKIPSPALIIQFQAKVGGQMNNLVRWLSLSVDKLVKRMTRREVTTIIVLTRIKSR